MTDLERAQALCEQHLFIYDNTDVDMIAAEFAAIRRETMEEAAHWLEQRGDYRARQDAADIRALKVRP